MSENVRALRFPIRVVRPVPCRVGAAPRPLLRFSTRTRAASPLARSSRRAVSLPGAPPGICRDSRARPARSCRFPRAISGITPRPHHRPRFSRLPFRFSLQPGNRPGCRTRTAPRSSRQRTCSQPINELPEGTAELVPTLSGAVPNRVASSGALAPEGDRELLQGIRESNPTNSTRRSARPVPGPVFAPRRRFPRRLPTARGLPARTRSTLHSLAGFPVRRATTAG